MMPLQSVTVAPPQRPPGLILFPGLAAPRRSRRFHQYSVLFLTFLAYAAFHASRKPPSIVKSILTTTTNQTLPINSDPDVFQFAGNETGWVPFDGPRGPNRLGDLDTSFLLTYSIGMFFAGHIGDTVDLRIFLTIGMVGSGVFVILFGLCFFLDLHSFGVFVMVQMFCGLFQSIGWPCVVAIVGNWFGKAKRGLIMGVWNSHTSVGNIIGSLIASSVLGFGWGWSFVLPGILIMLLAVVVYFFLVVHPAYAGFELSENDGETSVEQVALVDSKETGKNVEGVASVDSEETGRAAFVDSVETGMNIERVALVDSEETKRNVEGAYSEETRMNGEGAPHGGIGFLEAWRLPHVQSYALCLFFSKLVAYTFLYWLPFYIKQTAVAGVHLSHSTAGNLSTIFDIGGVLGGISAGLISDLFEARAVTSVIFLVLSIPTLISYHLYGSTSMLTNTLLMFASGLLVNGPYSLITTAVATDLGTQDALRGRARALATVTAIIDGTGSVGAALGPLLTGYIQPGGWSGVFFMLIVSISFAAFLLIPVVRNEIQEKHNKGRWLWIPTIVR